MTREAMEAMGVKTLEQEPCDDCISRKSIKQKLQENHDFFVNAYDGFSNLPQNDKARVDEITNCIAMVVNEPSVKPQEPKTGHCKECKYFEYDSVAKVDGIPLIVAHEICNKWGDGCKTSEDGYCYLYDPQESEE
jgi:hypothetical protein